MKIELSRTPQNPVTYTWQDLMNTAAEGIYKCTTSESARFLVVGEAHRVILFVTNHIVAKADNSWESYLFTLTNDTLTIKSEA